ncbi:MAG: ribosome silencing factor [Polaromonas sp. 28-63-22]|nr:MAG: ribosome silencing factor [Polaromonas sp. 28-63-22]
MTLPTAKTSSTLEKKDVQKLQRAIIDGLEDVKAQDIQVFDTEHITSLFERVIVASGSSNRQTKALAASVRDAVRDAGFAKPRIEGEENGEWIIVDCGAAVAHIMQPTIRQYYHLEELWGEKPVKLKLGAPAPLVKAAKAAPKDESKTALPAKAGARSPAKSRARAGAKPAVKAPVRDHEPGYIGKLGKTSDWTAKRNEAAPVAEPVARVVKAAKAAKAPAKTATAKPLPRSAAKTPAKAAPKSARTPVVEVPVAKKAAARKVAAKSAAKPAARKTAPRSR